MQDTPLNKEASSPAGCGVCMIDHVEPFHRSAIAAIEPFSPTATQCVPGQDAPLRPPPVLGVAASDHLVPFQCSAGALSAPRPTAQQLASRWHDTAFRTVLAAGAARTTDHRLPVQCSTRGLAMSGLSGLMAPAAQHRPAVGHE